VSRRTKTLIVAGLLLGIMPPLLTFFHLRWASVKTYLLIEISTWLLDADFALSPEIENVDDVSSAFSDIPRWRLAMWQKRSTIEAEVSGLYPQSVVPLLAAAQSSRWKKRLAATMLARDYYEHARLVSDSRVAGMILDLLSDKNEYVRSQAESGVLSLRRGGPMARIAFRNAASKRDLNKESRLLLHENIVGGMIVDALKRLRETEELSRDEALTLMSHFEEWLTSWDGQDEADFFAYALDRARILELRKVSASATVRSPVELTASLEGRGWMGKEQSLREMTN